ncbi:uncharacterized protein J8A68_003649 [[Candida] subhashii]|uniref:Uncharacterized protein n=1 Tax=[Candida] subhashii TaxID=561895 RepID=A0A8J5UW86_9ASCO|nr:uncharacterized protein J8A68_003649 [[Candida] subhashii]KAG7662795.1 hypothetical protein J8A68_003649 [[Candida] subhashii]
MITNDEPNQVFENEVLLTVDSFGERFLIENRENSLFRCIRPNYVEFVFTRQVFDYRMFMTNLYTFNELISTEKYPRVQEYFATKILQLSFYIDANLMMIENPDSLTTIILKNLLDLSRNDLLVNKVKKMTIRGTDIGNIYVPQWTRLFRRFKSLEYLDISQNLLQNNHDGCIDVWGIEKRLPDYLQVLHLDWNFFTHISKDMLIQLPQSLKILSLNNNEIEIIEICSIGELLPNLIELDLKHNHLSFISPEIFSDCKGDFVLHLEANKLDPANLEDVRRMANKNGFKVVY